MFDIDKYLEDKYPITKGMSTKNCNKAMRSRHYFKLGYLFGIRNPVSFDIIDTNTDYRSRTLKT